MSRMRTLKPSFWVDRKVTKLSFAARLWFQGMWNFAVCDAGHVEDDAYELRLKVFPADQVDEDALTDEVLASEMVVRKRMPDGRTYLHVVNMGKHQKVDPRWATRCPYCAHETSPEDVAPEGDFEISAGLTETPASSSEPEGEPESSADLSLGVGVGLGVGEVQNLPSSPGDEDPPPDPDPAPSQLDLDVRASPPPPRSKAAWFTEFWRWYPRKVGKLDAQKVFERVATGKHAKVHPQVLIEAAKRLSEDENLPEPDFIPHPATWLNRGGWEDEPYPPKQQHPTQRAPSVADRRHQALNRQRPRRTA